MGCASSRPRRCRHCHHEPYSPVPRSYSAHRQSYDRAEKGGDCYHVVALKSSTLGSLKLDLKNQENRIHGGNNLVADRNTAGKGNEGLRDAEEKKGNESPVEVIKAKVWLDTKEDEEVVEITKIETKTPVRTPVGEPETINAWELMEGLEDDGPLRSPTHSNSKSFSFNSVPNPASFHQKPKSPENPQISPAPAPMWLHMSNEDQNQSIPPENSKNPKSVDSKSDKDRAVVYFTSLRGVRKTYEDCCHVRVILKGLGIRLDERDVSLHSGFKEELKDLMGDDLKAGLGLPKVFLGKRYIGGADEIRRLNEDGKMEKLFQGCENVEDCDGGTGNACEACGDIRFVPCETCSGSCKVFYDGGDEEEGEQGECGFQRCPDCNENGLIRCPVCWD